MGHLTFLSKRLSAVEKKGFRNSLLQHLSRVHGVIALVDSTWVFLLLSFYIVVSWNMSLFKA